MLSNMKDISNSIMITDINLEGRNLKMIKLSYSTKITMKIVPYDIVAEGKKEILFCIVPVSSNGHITFCKDMDRKMFGMTTRELNKLITSMSGKVIADGDNYYYVFKTNRQAEDACNYLNTLRMI